MKRAVGTSFYVALLLLVLQGRVGAYQYENGRTNERTHERHQETITRTDPMPRDNENQWDYRDYENQWENRDYWDKWEESVARGSSQHQNDPSPGGMRTGTLTTHSTTTGTRTKERNDYNTINGGRSSETGVKRTSHDYSGTGTTMDRTHHAAPPPRTGETEKREEGHYHTRDGTTTTTKHGGHDDIKKSGFRTDSKNVELHERQSSTAMVIESRAAPPRKSSAEERMGGTKKEPAAQAKADAEPIGLINALDTRIGNSRSFDLKEVDPRALDPTTTIIAAVLIGVAVLIFLMFCIAEVAKKRREKKADSTRLLRVFQYLHEFNVDDIDIQLSAAGGFHVGYLNELAQGVNTKKQSDQKTSDSDSSSGSLSNKV